MSFQAIMQAFSREALDLYIPVMQEEVRAAVQGWLSRDRDGDGDACVLVYPEVKRLMFRIAMRLLLGFQLEQIKTDEQQLVEAFEEMIKNLFSLPIDVPFSGLYRVSTVGGGDTRTMAWWRKTADEVLLPQGLKARNFIHAKIEENIKRKLQESSGEAKHGDQESNGGSKHRDALQQLIDSSLKSGQALSMQVKII